MLRDLFFLEAAYCAGMHGHDPAAARASWKKVQRRHAEIEAHTVLRAEALAGSASA